MHWVYYYAVQAVSGCSSDGVRSSRVLLGMEPGKRKPPTQKAPPATGVDGTEEKPSGAVPIDWWVVDELARPEYLLLLHEFLMKFVESYQLSESVVPPCWFKHEQMLQEVLAMYQYRQQSQYAPAGGPRSPIEFHAVLFMWVERMRRYVVETGCNALEHRPGRTPLWVVPGTMQAAEYLAELEFVGVPVNRDGEGEVDE